MSVIGLLSYKGGVGVSTLSLGMARSFSGHGYKVLLVDCRYAGDLDILAGCESSSLFCFSDLDSADTLKRCITKADGFDFCPAPAVRETAGNAYMVVCGADDYDYIILDSPSDPAVCDTVLCVAEPLVSSLRSCEMLADNLGEILKSTGTKKTECMLAVNKFGKYEDYILPEDMIDRTGLRLAGIVPFVPYMTGNNDFEFRNAVENISLRLCGKSIPLFTGSDKSRTFRALAGI